MTYMKPLSGHSSVKWIRYYLFKNDRALDKDFLNLTDRDWKGRDWAKVMDRTREIFGNNVPVKKDAKVRTYEHMIISLDEKDGGVELDDFRDFVNEWASKWFDSRGPEGEGIGRFEVAIAYHDDNKARGIQGKQGILHAHLVINNTELETKRRISGLLTTKVIQAMRADLQTMSLERGWHAFATDGKSYTQAEMDARGLQVSRGKRLDRAMAALDNVLANEAKGAQDVDLGKAMMERMEERYPVRKMVPETYGGPSPDEANQAEREPGNTRPGDVPGFSYTTMRTEDGKVLRLVVPFVLQADCRPAVAARCIALRFVCPGGIRRHDAVSGCPGGPRRALHRLCGPRIRRQTPHLAPPALLHRPSPFRGGNLHLGPSHGMVDGMHVPDGRRLHPLAGDR